MAKSFEDSPTIPDARRRAMGPVVVIECFEEIPCDPCHDACNQGAIETFDDINGLPKIDFTKCNGCGRCIPVCPGLAIFVVDETWKEGLAVVRIPYEFLPLPEKGQQVKGLSRDGVEVCDVKVVKVENTRRHDRTPVVWVEVPKPFAMEVRHIRVGGTSLEK
ncbi:MAG: 4Fe-4S binding protein [Bacillota bacterium]|nr:4Fe-4S binding protein [Bacillota bacterium]MDI9415250.1 4Fe-4S binding protein [Bacillota bacterium]HOB88406.1 4Fe-4S binding protein [Bacillota bacterium]HOJ57592.1 4Fe-4S binding protein [Bacillota bacterium]HOL01967.1 4Fe-4S binding protein [Bacillota bacterium]